MKIEIIEFRVKIINKIIVEKGEKKGRHQDNLVD